VNRKTVRIDLERDLGVDKSAFTQWSRIRKWLIENGIETVRYEYLDLGNWVPDAIHVYNSEEVTLLVLTRGEICR